MFLLANLVDGIAFILDAAISIYTWILIIHVILSWIRLDPFHPIVRALANISDLLLDPIRRFIPMGNIGIDLSPLVGILLLQFTRLFVVRSLRQIADRL